MDDLILRNVEVEGCVIDVVATPDGITALGPGIKSPHAEFQIDGRGGALIPGLWDHHIHLMSLAAARSSIVVGPPNATGRSSFEAILRQADRRLAPGQWLRAVGYHDSVAGRLDCDVLDDVVRSRPVRIQHRSGALWVLNSAGMRAVDAWSAPAGLFEVDENGRPNGRLLRSDDWLRRQISVDDPPDLRPASRQLSSYGVIGITDATPYPDWQDLETLGRAVADGVEQRVFATGGTALSATSFPEHLGRGPVKIMLHDRLLPPLHSLSASIAEAHAAGRPVAVHCVTLEEAALTLAARREAGAHSGDRMEHASVITPDLAILLAEANILVVTQPNFISERGDQYLAEVSENDIPHLYRCGSLLRAGIRISSGTDAPFGSPDPWQSIAAAVGRRTAQGRPLGLEEAITAEQALSMFLGSANQPHIPRRLRLGEPADLCLLDSPLTEVLADPRADRVVTTVVGGKVVHTR